MQILLKEKYLEDWLFFKVIKFLTHHFKKLISPLLLIPAAVLVPFANVEQETSAVGTQSYLK